MTALWLAAGEGRKAVAADLIAKGADVNNRRTDGITAVMAAAVGGHKVSCDYLALCVGREARLGWGGAANTGGPMHHCLYLTVTCELSVVHCFQLPVLTCQVSLVMGPEGVAVVGHHSLFLNSLANDRWYT